MVVAFLTTQVQAPNWDDYKKLAKVLNYLHTTHDLLLTLEASNAGVAEWRINGAFGNHSWLSLFGEGHGNLQINVAKIKYA